MFLDQQQLCRKNMNKTYPQKLSRNIKRKLWLDQLLHRLKNKKYRNRQDNKSLEDPLHQDQKDLKVQCDEILYDKTPSTHFMKCFSSLKWILTKAKAFLAVVHLWVNSLGKDRPNINMECLETLIFPRCLMHLNFMASQVSCLIQQCSFQTSTLTLDQILCLKRF